MLNIDRREMEIMARPRKEDEFVDYLIIGYLDQLIIILMENL